MKSRSVILRLLKRFLTLQKSIFIILIIFLIMTLFSFFYPIVIKNITDLGMVQKDIKIITEFSLLLLLLLSAEQIISLIQAHLCITLKNRFQKALFSDAFSKLLHLKMDYFENKNSTEVIDKLSTDIRAISILADNSIMNLVNYILRLVSGSIGLLIIDVRLACAVYLLVPIKFIFITQTAKKKERYMENYIEESRKFSSWFSDMISGVREIKLWNLYTIKDEKFISKQETLLAAGKKSTIMDAYNGFSDAILNGLLTSALYFFGGWLIYKDYLSIGSLIAFITYSAYITGPISALFNMKYILSSIAPSAKRLFEFLDLEEEGSGDLYINKNSFESLTLSEVNFSYDQSSLLRDINLTIKKGEKIAIIGKNGSGKTTLLKLLLGFISPDSGTILLNGININDYNISYYRDLFSIVSQDIYLFQDSIKNNIDLQESCSADEVRKVCNMCFMNELISSLSLETESIVEKNGSNFSGGEKQKIALARAILKEAPFIILDEVTSNLDAVSNKALFDLILSDCKEKTIILITHDYENLMIMDNVYKIVDGKLHSV